MRIQFLIVSAFLGLAACGGGGSGSTPAPTPTPIAIGNADIQAINALLTDFANANTQNKIVGSVSQQTVNGEQVYVFEFTDGTEISAATRLVDSVLEDTTAWRATVTFIDDQTHAFFLRGTSIGITDSDIDLNPFGIAPLSARADFSTPVPGQISLVVRARDANGIAMGHEFTAQGTVFSLPVLGLYADFANQVEFRFSDVAGNLLVTDVVTVQTQAVAASFDFNILQNDLAPDDDGVYMIADTKLAFDQTGALRWAITDPDVNYVWRKLSNGNMTATNADIRAVYHFGAFTETTMLGEVIERYDVTNLVHHEARLDEGTGTYLVGGNSFLVTGIDSWMDGLPEEDVVLEIDRVTKQVVNQWDFNTILDPDRIGINNPASRPEDWAHINAIYYDPEDTSFVASVRNQSTVAKIDYETGTPIWLLGSHTDWPPSLSPYLLTPIDENGTPIDVNTPGFWQSAQHAPMKLPNGDILLYDNGNDRGLYTDEDGPLYSRVAQYRIDEDAMTVQLVSVFPEHQDWYTPATGDVDYLPLTGGRLLSYLWGSSDTPRLIELDADGDVVFEATQDLGANYYRAEKFRLYEGIQ